MSFSSPRCTTRPGRYAHWMMTLFVIIRTFSPLTLGGAKRGKIAQGVHGITKVKTSTSPYATSTSVRLLRNAHLSAIAKKKWTPDNLIKSKKIWNRYDTCQSEVFTEHFSGHHVQKWWIILVLVSQDECNFSREVLRFVGIYTQVWITDVILRN